MKVFCYFVEPASYTLDLIANIYSKQNISYCFIYAKSFAQSNNSSSNDLYLSKYSLFSRVKYIFRVQKSHDFIIINGYNNYPFLLTFILNLFSSNRKYIAIDSDSQLNIPKNLLKRFVKNLPLAHSIFSRLSKYKIIQNISTASNQPVEKKLVVPAFTDEEKFQIKQEFLQDNLELLNIINSDQEKLKAYNYI